MIEVDHISDSPPTQSGRVSSSKIRPVSISEIQVPPPLYSDKVKTGLRATFLPQDVLEFETLWLNAGKTRTNRGEAFPRLIEGLSPQIWFESYLRECEMLHKDITPCQLCNRIRSIMDTLKKCPCKVISALCKTCKQKLRYAPYLDRGFLMDFHRINLYLLTNGEVGERKLPPSRSRPRPSAKAWTDPQNKNRKGESLEQQIKGEISKFSITAKAPPFPACSFHRRPRPDPCS